MIYEIRMTVIFDLKGTDIECHQGGGLTKVPLTKKVKVTLIDYIEANGVAKAFNKAAEYKHEVIIEIAKGESLLFAKKAWGERSDNISISLDAVVGKPEIELIMARKEGKSKFLRKRVSEIAEMKELAAKSGIPVATLMQMKKRGYKVVKLVEKD